jgi:WD40 repeat protein
MLSASDDATVKVWAVPGFEVVRTLQGHTDYVSKAHAAGPGRAVSSSKDGTLRLWDLGSGECLRTMEHGDWPSKLHASPDGRRAVACSAYVNVMRIWSLESGEVERVLVEARGTLHEIEGLVLVTGMTGTGMGHQKPAKHILFLPDGRTFLTSEVELILWDAASGAELFRIPGDGWWIGGLALVPETRQVFAAGMDAVRVFDLDARAIVAEAPWPHGDAHNVAVSPDGRWGASGSSDGFVGLWDLAALVAAGRPDRHLSGPRAFAVTNDGRRALTASADRSARLWDLERKTNKVLRYDEGLFVEPVAFTADGRRALIMTKEGVLRAYSAETGEPLGEAREKGDTTTFQKWSFVRDGRLLVGSVSGPLTLWSLDPLGSIETFDLDAGHVSGMAVAEAEDRVVTAQFGSGDFLLTVDYWSLRERTRVRQVRLELYAYGTDVVIAGALIVVPTSTGVVVVLDREGRLLRSTQATDKFIPDATLLSNGVVALGGSKPALFDPATGSVIGLIPLGPKQTAKTIRGEPRAFVIDPSAGLALLDYEALTLSPFTPIERLEYVETSANGKWAVAGSSRDEWVGAPLVLRRI